MTADQSVDLQYLKQISRLKHHILKNYLPAWSAILFSAHSRLFYMDCFAGSGMFRDEDGNLLPGSPLIALQTAKTFASKGQGRQFLLGFAEKNQSAAERLRMVLAAEGGIPGSVDFFVDREDAQMFADDLIQRVKGSGPGTTIVPSFFFVDPYGHPITLPTIRRLMSLGERTEVLVNLMWYRISMDLKNPLKKQQLDMLFGHSDWQRQPFMKMSGRDREVAFVDYFVSQVGMKYALRFVVPYSPEDKVRGWENRTKYYLLHFSKHPRAALLMKDVMWSVKKDIELLKFNITGQRQLFDLIPEGAAAWELIELREALLGKYEGATKSFDDIREETIDLPYVQPHYRAVCHQLEKEGFVDIIRIDSKKTGIQKRDRILFMRSTVSS